MNPKKKYSVRQNKDSVQCYIDGEYVGSMSKKKLCEMFTFRTAKHTEDEHTQKPNVTDEEFKGLIDDDDDFNTNNVYGGFL